ncbi:MAG: type II secretion system F family protein [Clostridia bacterium]|nr:type II secretion system F family protein [Clostridia bacterium]
MEQAVKYLDESEALTKKVRKILVPNLLQFGGLLLLLVIGTLAGVPLIQNVFEQVGSQDQLPGPTLWFKGVLDKLIQFWYIPTAMLVATVVSIYLYIKTPRGRYNFHYFKYKMPIFGSLIYAIDFSRLIKAILLNIKNGMRIQEALETSKNITNNLVMLSLIESSINNILIGQSWIEPFEKSGLSSPMITEMLKIGMQTDLAEMMEKLLEYIEMDIDNIMQRIMKVLPQIVYSLVGVVLIFVTIIVLVPMIQVYMGTWMFSAYL